MFQPSIEAIVSSVKAQRSASSEKITVLYHFYYLCSFLMYLHSLHSWLVALPQARTFYLSFKRSLVQKASPFLARITPRKLLLLPLYGFGTLIRL